MSTKQWSHSDIMNSHAHETLELFRAKAFSLPKLHYTSKARIGERSIEEWLSALSQSSMHDGKVFLKALGRSRAWVRTGNSRDSRLVQALS
jgi:hypothetical protein